MRRGRGPPPPYRGGGRRPSPGPPSNPSTRSAPSRKSGPKDQQQDLGRRTSPPREPRGSISPPPREARGSQSPPPRGSPPPPYDGPPRGGGGGPPPAQQPPPPYDRRPSSIRGRGRGGPDGGYRGGGRRGGSTIGGGRGGSRIGRGGGSMHSQMDLSRGRSALYNQTDRGQYEGHLARGPREGHREEARRRRKPPQSKKSREEAAERAAVNKKGHQDTKIKSIAVYVVNAIVMATGLAMLVIGTILFSKLMALQEATKGLIKWTALLLIVSGVLVILVSILGFIGVYSRNRIVLLIYCMILFLIFSIVLGTGIAVFVLAHNSFTVQDYMEDTMIGYKLASVKKSWDFGQKSFECCGIHDGKGYEDWTFAYRTYVLKKGMVSLSEHELFKGNALFSNASIEDLDEALGLNELSKEEKESYYNRGKEGRQYKSKKGQRFLGGEGAGKIDIEKLKKMLRMNIPISCCINQKVWTFKKRSKIPKEVCDMDNRNKTEDRWADGCLPRFKSKATGIGIMCMALSGLLLLGMITALMVLVAPDKFLKPQTKSKVKSSKV